jgi:hypothetical protein
LAVSPSNALVEGMVSDALEGWHWATRAEVEAVLGWGTMPETRNYFNQGGWGVYRWEGVPRVTFLFQRTSGDPAANTTCYNHTRGHL